MPKSRKKLTKTSPFKVQGHSRLSMLINLKSLSVVLVMICSNSVPICNCFHTIRVFTHRHEILSLKTRVFGAAKVKILWS